MTLTPYQVQASILNPKIKPTKEQQQTINSFFFTRWLSANRFTVPIAGVINRFYNIPVEIQFRFAQDYSDLVGLPGKVKFIGIPKEKKHEDYQKLLNNIMKYYKINENHAEEYFKLLPDHERDRMFKMYDVGLQK